MVAVLVPSFDPLNLIFPRATISSLRVYTRCLLAEVMIDLHSTIVGHCKRNSRKVVLFLSKLSHSPSDSDEIESPFTRLSTALFVLTPTPLPPRFIGGGHSW